MRLLAPLGWLQGDRIDQRSEEGPEKARRKGMLRGLVMLKPITVGNPSSSSELSKDDRPLFRSCRRRNSTLSIVDLQEHRQARFNRKVYCAQRQSIFFEKLPAEIRMMIYEYVAGPGRTVHLTLGGRPMRFGHFVCQKDLATSPDESRGVLDVEIQPSPSICRCSVLVGGNPGARWIRSDLLKLSLTCRKSYIESISYLYSIHTFSLLHQSHILLLPSSLPSPRLHQIRTLRLRWLLQGLPYFCRPTSPTRYAYPDVTRHWAETWRIVASMEGLRDLEVVIKELGERYTWANVWANVNQRILEDMKRAHARRFVVWLPYESCKVDWDLGSHGMELRRPGDGQ